MSQTISVDRLVPSGRGAVFAFLVDLGNHWSLADAAIEVLTLERSGGVGTPADGGRVRLRGPLGIRRTVVTRVDAVEPPVSIAGTALVGDRTRARVRWELADAGEAGTRVTLVAVVGESSRVDRLLLRAGGRAWLHRRLDRILARLEQRLCEAQRSKVATSRPLASAFEPSAPLTSPGEAPAFSPSGADSA
jgi:hypothetical protein